MTNRNLRKAVLAKLKVTPQAISQQVKDLKRVVPMSTEEGWYTLAAMKGIDISKFLDPDEVDKIRGLLGEVRRATAAAQAQTVKTAKTRPSPTRPVHITIAPNIKLDDPLLPSAVAAEAKFMAERVYPMVYVLENSMRAFIARIMQAAHGENWWESHVPSSVTNPVSDRMKKDQRLTWHGKRSAHPIYYTDTPHLIDIVEANWPDFKPFLPKKEFFTERLWEINHSRRIIAHNNPLAVDDQKRIEVYFQDWENHVSAIGSSLP